MKMSHFLTYIIMTKKEHRKQGLTKAYYSLVDAEKALLGHKENQEVISLIHKVKDKILEILNG